MHPELYACARLTETPVEEAMAVVAPGLVVAVELGGEEVMLGKRSVGVPPVRRSRRREAPNAPGMDLEAAAWLDSTGRELA